MNSMPQEVADIRAEICSHCPTPCDKAKDSAYHRHPCSECPLTPRRWAYYGQCQNFKAPQRGLGDLVYAFANPIAKAIDSMAGTNIEGCGGCKKRREALNRMLPNIGE